MNDADLLEECSDHIVTRLEHWVMDHPDCDQAKMAAIKEFVEYCCQEDQKDLDVPRAPDGKSFRQRREEAKPERLAALDELTAQAQELNMGYEAPKLTRQEAEALVTPHIIAVQLPYPGGTWVYQAVKRELVQSLIGEKLYEQLLKDKIRNVGPTPDTIYVWNVVDYVQLK